MLSNTANLDKSIKYSYSAPAKFILSGEHSVVYGKDALVATIDMRTRGESLVSFDKDQEGCLVEVQLKQLQQNFKLTLQGTKEIISSMKYEWNTIQEFFQKFEGPIRQVIPDIKEDNIINDERIHFLYSLLHSLKYVIGIQQNYLPHMAKVAEFLNTTGFKISIDSELPIAKGVGSSASYAVVIAASFLKFWELVFREYFGSEGSTLDFSNFEEFKNHVNQVAFEFEKIFHSTPSGLDNSAITYGGILAYNKVEQKRDQVNVDFLDSYEIVLIDSGVEKNTKKTVDMIRSMTQSEYLSQATVSTINAIGDITKSIAKVLGSQVASEQEILTAQKNFDQLIKMNHCLLRALNLTNAKIDKIIEICDKYNFSSKLTGGGDGGYCVCFIPKSANSNNVTEFLSVLQKEGFETTKLRFAKTGLIEERKPAL